MEKQILFTEVQRQNQKWIWFLLIILTATLLFGSIQQIVFNRPFGTHPIPDWGYLPFFGVLFLASYLLFGSRLYTEISRNEIRFRFKPFHRKARVIPWEEVSRCYVRLYSPIKEFGGWGIRIAFHRKAGKAYSISGNNGIQIELKNGEKILLGTRKGYEAQKVLKSIQTAG
jgi:hypothetical protein